MDLVQEIEEFQLQALIKDYIWNTSRKKRSQMDKQWFQDFLMELHGDLSEILDVPKYCERKKGKMTLVKRG